ncbi:uncharacterized protein B0I36DRAFT_121632 [Microdochium trichocladiopsis]|uniref:Uncharacterized protein n=1 Tax=Microdochium trichocladiopsis TaxID=1682393 RepID=A0A9P8Y6S9_9PEZI|nr:uncharacterized protein B0I36DRAFT_121632 [Microdochium trichocladiopsis]KAH7031329.1 hypothetical protein B0I36DRAFT_121632 [Microdochium trichocladiopsis]
MSCLPQATSQREETKTSNITLHLHDDHYKSCPAGCRDTPVTTNQPDTSMLSHKVTMATLGSRSGRPYGSSSLGYSLGSSVRTPTHNSGGPPILSWVIMVFSFGPSSSILPFRKKKKRRKRERGSRSGARTFEEKSTCGVCVNVCVCVCFMATTRCVNMYVFIGIGSSRRPWRFQQVTILFRLLLAPRSFHG